MCGVIGVRLSDATERDLENLKRLFLETMIRGKHATGVSWVKNDVLETVKEPVSASEFLKSFDLSDCVNEDGGLYLIGHIRYSTSDLRYNQPFSDGATSIVHNGVISQEHSSTWKYPCKTQNDSEMILHSIQAGKHPLSDFPDASLSVCTLTKDKTLSAYRNGERPLWYVRQRNGFIFMSTEDIALRAGYENPVSTMMNMVHTVTDNGMSTYIEESNDSRDLQRV